MYRFISSILPSAKVFQRPVIACGLSLLCAATHATIDIGIARNYNAFIENNFTANSTDIQGKLAVGGNVSLENYGIAAEYEMPSNEYSLVVGGDIHYEGGKIFYGSAIAGGDVSDVAWNVKSSLQPGATLQGNANIPVDFDSEFTTLRNLSDALVELPKNGTAEFKWGGLHFTGDCHSETQVFQVSGANLLSATYVSLNCIPTDSTVLVNVTGDTAGFQSIGLSPFAPHATTTLFNFPEATQINVSWVGVEGSLLAPNATFDNPHGSVNGTVVAKSWNGQMELHHIPFVGTFEGVSLSTDPDHVNHAPTVESLSDIELSETESTTLLINASDIDGDTLSYSIQNAPSFVQLLDGAITIAPDYGSAGQYGPIKIIVSDGTEDVLIDFVLKVANVNQAPIINLVEYISVQEGSSAEIVFEASDPDGDNLTLSYKNLPAFASVESGGTIQLSPSLEDAGIYESVTVTANDGQTQVSEQITITVLNVAIAPTITSSPITTVPENSTYSYQVAVQADDSDTLHYEIESSIETLAIDPITGLVTWQASTQDIGSHNILIRVISNQGLKDEQHFTLVVTNVNDAPTATDKLFELNEDENIAFQLSGRDSDNDPLSIEIVTQPSQGVLVESEGGYIYTPVSNYSGEDSFLYRVNDGEYNSDTAKVVFDIRPVNDTPEFTSSPLIEASEGETYRYTLTATDIENAEITYELVTAPSGMDIDKDSGEIQWVIDYDASGSYSILVSASDGELSSQRAFTLTVLDVNRAPRISGEPSQIIDEGQLYQFAVNAYDDDGDDISYILQSELSVLGISETGVVGGSLNYATAGEYEVVISVSDGSEMTELSYTLTVQDVNRLPQVSDFSHTIPTNQSSNFTISAVDPDGDPLSYAITSFPIWGEVKLNGDAVTYTPTDGFVGEDTLVYQASDGKGYTEVTVTLVVSPENKLPEIISEPKKFTAVGAVYVYQVEAFDGDGDELSYRLKAGPETMSIDESSGMVQWLPVKAGLEEIIIEVDDGKGGVTEHRFTIDSISDVAEVTYTGTEFWLMFNAQMVSNVDLSLSGIEFYLFLGSLSEDDVNVSVDVPGLSYHKSITIEPSSISQVNLTELMPELNFDELGVSDTGIRVSADAEISVVLLNRKAASTDSALVLPVKAQGKSYIVTSYTSPKYTKIRGYGNKGGENRPYLGVVATQDNTEVIVTPSFTYNDGEIEREKNVAYAITLDQGQTYQVYGKGDITGTVVDADKPVAVFSGNSCAYLQEMYCDTLVENLLPVSAWSAQYYVAPLALRKKGDTFVVYAAFDDTIIDVNGVKIAKLHRGEHYEFIEDQASNISGNKPFALMQFSNGSMYDQKNTDPIGDPAMLMMQSVDHYLSEYIVTTLPDTILTQAEKPFRYHFANLMAHEKVKDTILLDGEPVSVEWKRIPYSDYYGASIALVSGVHKFMSVGRFGLYVYGFDRYDSYAHFGGSVLTKQVVPGTLVLKQDGNASLMAGDQACMLAEIADNKVDPVSRGQVLFSAMDKQNGYVQSQVSISNADGIARACFRNPTSSTLDISAHWAGLSQNIEISWLENTRSMDAAPIIVSDPNFYVAPGESYAYAVKAIDPNGDLLRYALSEKLDGMQIDENTGEITWLAPIDFNETVITVQVSDDSYVVEQRYRLATEPGLNRAPVFQTNPETDFIQWNPSDKTVDGPFIANHTYTYAVKVFDPDYDQDLIYSVKGPEGMSIRSDDGLLGWIPNQDQVGIHDVEISVDDRMGAVNTQKFTLKVIEDNYPILAEGIPLPQIATQGNLYAIQITGSDIDGDKVSYELITPPSGMTISNAGGDEGNLRWVPNESQVGNHDVQMRISDGTGKSVDIIYPITVKPNIGPSLIAGKALLKWSYNYQQCETYSFNDPEGDSLSISALEKPSTMSVKTYVTGGITHYKICWMPQYSDAGRYEFEISASDITGEMVKVSVSLDVVDDLIVAEEPVDQQILVSQTMKTRFRVFNPGEDKVAYTLSPQLTGMSIDNASGIITWLPTGDDVGQYLIEVVAKANDKSVEAQFNIEVRNINEAPIVSGIAPMEIQARRPFEYAISASDGNNDTLTFTKGGGFPTHLKLSESGNLSWTPYDGEVGLHQFKVVVEDGFGGQVIVPMEINVVPFENTAPELVSDPSYGAVIGYLYQEQLHIIDADGDPITVTKLNGTPTSVTVDVAGAIQWQPEFKDEGLVNIGVRLADDYSFREYYWTVDVKPTLSPVVVRAFVVPQYLQEGEQTELSIALEGGINPVVDNITVDGEPIALQEAYSYLINANGVGRHELVISATDSQTNETANTTVFYAVADADDDEAPVVTLVAPGEQVEVTKVVDVVGSVVDDNLAEWLLFYRPAGANDENYTVLARGDTSFEEQVVAEFDATQLSNGMYQVVLQATDINNKTVTKGANVIVDGSLKIGNFGFTVEDLSISMSGIPITVTRTYDSRRKDSLMDFSYGWSIDYQNIVISESVEPSLGWERVEKKALFNVEDSNVVMSASCLYPVGEKVVTITLPSGDVETFGVRAENLTGAAQSVSDPNCYLTAGQFYRLVFDPKDSTQSSLASKDGEYLAYSNESGNLAADITEVDAMPINLYTLTTRSGYIYELDQHFGILTVTDPNGNTLTYSDEGVLHSSGKSIVFERDGQGRIEKIRDPKNNIYRYYYDDNGDLKEVRDAHQVTEDVTGVTYTYDNEHALTDILDPLGRKIVKNLYDDEGRLYAQEDGEGNTKYFNHNLDANTSIITDRDGRTTTFVYDDEGLVKQEIVAIGDGSYSEDIVTAYTYDDNGNQETKFIGSEEYTWTTKYNDDNTLSYSIDPERHRIDYLEYNALGQETKIQDEMGRKTSMDYDTAGNLTQIEMPAVLDPETNEEVVYRASNVINAKGQVEKTTDLRGLTTTYTYYPASHPSAGMKWTESNPETGTITYTYDANNNIETEIRERTVNGVIEKETVTYHYDARNRLEKTIYPDDSYTETKYDLAGNIDKERDRFGVWTDYTYDAYGRLRETRYTADDTTEKRDYTKEGLLKSVTDRSEHTTRYEYDDAGRQWKVHYHDQTYTETQYTPQGWVKYEWDEKRNLTEYEYDFAGRRKAVLRHYTDSDGTPQVQRHSFTYYDNGELETETDANNHTTTYVINALDQRTETLYHNETSIKADYDPMGARKRSTDQRQIATDYRYDKMGRLKEVQPDVTFDGTRVPNTEYTYDEVGNKLTQTDANGHTTRWTYDYFGRVTSRTLPELMTETFIYDDIAHTQTHIDFNNQTTTTYYNDLGQVEKVDYDNGETESYLYWPNGQVRQVTDKNGVTEYVYDDRDRLDYEIQPNGHRLDYDYDDAGNRIQVKVTKGDTVISVTDYTYDDLNRLETVTDAQGITTYAYDPVGNLDTVDYPNGLQEDYDYNSVNQLTVLTIRNGEGDIVNSFTYGLDDTGRRDDITESDGRYTDYIYDDLYRLTGETITSGAGTQEHQASYKYDWVGNRTYETVNGVQTAYDYDDNDRLKSQGGVEYNYDDNGNLKTETQEGATTNYHYDERQRLYSVDTPTDTIDYTYNHNGIRTSQTTGGVTTDFVVDSNRDYSQVLLELENGTEVVRYTYGHDLISQEKGGNTSFFLYDGLGSTRALSDSDGTITDTYDYEAFGEILNQTGSTENNYLYTGEQYDSETGNYYLRARYMSPEVGRFDSMDTWMGNNHDPITLHKYLYANASPSNYVDPTGNFSIGSTLSAMNTMATLASRAQTAYNFYQIATGEQEISAKQIGFEILASMGGGKLIKMFSKRFRACRLGNSFIEGTLVSTPSGLTPIEEIEIGDLLYSYNEKTRELVTEEVIHLISGDKLHEIISFSVSGGEEISATDGHPFYIADEDARWLQAKDLDVGDLLVNRDGDKLPIVQLSSETRNSIVYNLTVANTHTFYVGEQNLLAHNSTCRIPHRAKPRLEQGNNREGWVHIRQRHIPGGGTNQGDLFAPGTTQFQIEQAANKIMSKGKRLSDPNARIQRFERKMVVNGKQANYRVIVDADDGNRIITMFPALGGP